VTGQRRGFSPTRRSCGDERPVAGDERSGALEKRDVDLAKRDADLARRIDLFGDRSDDEKNRSVFFRKRFEESLPRTIVSRKRSGTR
jgi:hypothetical protein